MHALEKYDFVGFALIVNWLVLDVEVVAEGHLACWVANIGNGRFGDQKASDKAYRNKNKYKYINFKHLTTTSYIVKMILKYTDKLKLTINIVHHLSCIVKS